MNDTYKVVCSTCRAYGSSRPLSIREICSHCAQATAHAHRVLGHTVEIVPPKRVERQRESVATQRLTGKRGW